MFLMRMLLATFLFALASVASAAHPLGSSLPTSQRKAVADLLQAPDPQRRAPAIARFRADGQDAATEFSAALTRSETTALGQLRRLLQLVRATDPAIAAITKELQAYQTAADAAKALVQTDHHKDKKKFAEMDRAFAEAEKAHKKLDRTLKPQSPLGQLLAALQWVAEIRRDQDAAAGKSADLATLPMGKVLEVEGAPAEIQALVKAIEPFIALREMHRVVSAAHAQMKWARPEQVQYAEILNERRVVLGLRPFLLAEKLSAASAGHSEEMVKLKYFAHESPVAANKGFGDRVRNAGFEGSGSGECIYAGGSAPAAAHQGWWYSDGHRLILYSNGPTAQGIAKFATTWTFLTGSFATFPL
jgi:uncharacterized protein YkwD